MLNLLRLLESTIFIVIKLLYRILEAGNYWFKTYYNYYINKLSIKQLTYNLYLLYSIEPFRVVSLQTDDTLVLVDTKFAA